MSTQTAPTPDEFFGTAQAGQAPAQPPQPQLAPGQQLPTADEFFAPPSVMDYAKHVFLPLLESEDQRREMAQRETNATNRVMDAIGVGYKNNYGNEPITNLTPDEETALKKLGWSGEDGGAIQRAYANAIVRPQVMALTAAWRGVSGILGGVEEGLNQIGQEVAGVDQLGTSLVHTPEAFGASLFGEFAGLPRVVTPLELATGRSIGVVGETERGVYDIDKLTPDNAQARVNAARETGSIPQAPLPATNDIHEVARRVAPETFDRYDALEAQKQASTQNLFDMAKEVEQSPEVLQTQREIDEILKPANGDVEALPVEHQGRLTELEGELENLLAPPEMEDLWKSINSVAEEQRVLEPDVAAAYNKAQELLPEPQLEQIDKVEAASKSGEADVAQSEAAKIQQEVDAQVKEPVEEAVERPTPRSTTALRSVEGTGPTQTRTLAAGIEAKAIERDITDGFGDLPEYHQVEMADQAERVVDLMNKDYGLARRIAMGDAQPPRGILPESVLVGVENRALAEGDEAFIHRLGNESRLVTAATTMGQRIRTLAERNRLSPVAAIQSIKKARLAAVKDAETATVSAIKDIKQELKRTAPSREIWNTFIKSITCVE